MTCAAHIKLRCTCVVLTFCITLFVCRRASSIITQNQSTAISDSTKSSQAKPFWPYGTAESGNGRVAALPWIGAAVVLVAAASPQGMWTALKIHASAVKL